MAILALEGEGTAQEPVAQVIASNTDEKNLLNETISKLLSVLKTRRVLDFA